MKDLISEVFQGFIVLLFLKFRVKLQLHDF